MRRCGRGRQRTSRQGAKPRGSDRSAAEYRAGHAADSSAVATTRPPHTLTPNSPVVCIGGCRIWRHVPSARRDMAGGVAGVSGRWCVRSRRVAGSSPAGGATTAGQRVKPLACFRLCGRKWQLNAGIVPAPEGPGGRLTLSCVCRPVGGAFPSAVAHGQIGHELSVVAHDQVGHEEESVEYDGQSVGRRG